MAMRDTRATMNISLPRSMKAWIDRQVRTRGYGTASEFMRSLVRDAKARQEQIEKSLVAAMKQPSSPMTKADWDAIRREGERRAEPARARARKAGVRRKSA